MLQGVKTLTVIIRISGTFLQNTSKSFGGNPLLYIYILELPLYKGAPTTKVEVVVHLYYIKQLCTTNS